MSEVTFTQLAAADLENIYDHIADDNNAAASKWIDVVHDRCTMLAGMPFSGHDRSELFAGMRSVTEGNYVIFYKPVKSGILIIRILHSKRDLGSFFQKKTLPTELK